MIVLVPALRHQFGGGSGGTICKPSFMCNCKDPEKCPLRRERLAKCMVYRARATTKTSLLSDTRFYIGAMPRAFLRKDTPTIWPLYTMGATVHRQRSRQSTFGSSSTRMLRSTSGGKFAGELPRNPALLINNIRDVTSASQRRCKYLACPRTMECSTSALNWCQNAGTKMVMCCALYQLDQHSASWPFD